MIHRRLRPLHWGVLFALIAGGGILAAFYLRSHRSEGVIGDHGGRASYAGSSSCRPCHEKFHQLWSTSRHGLAMQPLTPELVRAELTAQPTNIVVGDSRYRFILRTNGGEVRETSPGGERAYPVEHVMGGKNVYYFLTTLERGRLQVLPIAYDLRRDGWFNTAASGVRHFENRAESPLDWRDPLYTFNTSCHGCHVSQLSTNYEVQTDIYRTTWSEPGINCETCHGPSAEHIRVCREAGRGQKPEDLKITLTSRFTPEQHNASCASCHAKAAVLTGAYRPGEPFFDHFDLVTLENPDYYPDGRDLGENYTYTGWRMNSCAAASTLHCVHCHTSSGRTRFTGEQANEACLPCHEDRVRNAAAHTRHKPDGEGNKCVSCHMPKTEFARMVRSDHSFRPPMPRATIEFKSPNACNICHKDRDAAWSDGQVRRWHRDDYQDRALRPARLVAAARNRQWTRLPEMLAYIADSGRDEIYATSLLRLLGSSPDDRRWPAFEGAMRDPSPLVRAAAATALAGHLTPETARILAGATRDEVRLIRLRAAGSLAEYPLENLSPGERQAVETALVELESAYQSRPDDWANQFNLGNLYQSRGDLNRALQAYEFSGRLRTDVVEPLVNAALVYSRLGEQPAAQAALERALHMDPANAPANFNMGLLLAERGAARRAEECLRAALKADPGMAAAAYNLGVLLSEGRLTETLVWCRKARELSPGEPKYTYTLAFFLIKSGNSNEAVSLLRALLSSHPDYFDAYGLLASGYEACGDAKRAREVLTRGLQRAGLPAPERQALQARLQGMRE